MLVLSMDKISIVFSSSGMLSAARSSLLTLHKQFVHSTGLSVIVIVVNVNCYCCECQWFYTCSELTVHILDKFPALFSL